MRACTWILSLASMCGPAHAALEIAVSQPHLSGVWSVSQDKPLRAKLWVLEAVDQSLAIGGFDDRSSFSATCVITQANRAVCQGTGLAINFSNDVAQPPHRFLYKSELSLTGSVLKEVWEVQMLLTPEDQQKAGGKPVQTVKGEFLYQQLITSSPSR